MLKFTWRKNSTERITTNVMSESSTVPASIPTIPTVQFRGITLNVTKYHSSKIITNYNIPKVYISMMKGDWILTQNEVYDWKSVSDQLYHKVQQASSQSLDRYMQRKYYFTNFCCWYVYCRLKFHAPIIWTYLVISYHFG